MNGEAGLVVRAPQTQVYTGAWASASVVGPVVGPWTLGPGPKAPRANAPGWWATWGQEAYLHRLVGR